MNDPRDLPFQRTITGNGGSPSRGGMSVGFPNMQPASALQIKQIDIHGLRNRRAKPAVEQEPPAPGHQMLTT